MRDSPAVTTTARQPVWPPLLLVGVRCTVRYVVLPFVLPLFGAAAGPVLGVAMGVLVLLDVLAIVSVVTTLRWLWRRRHPRRWLYVLFALGTVLLAVTFLMNDVLLAA